VQLRKIETSKEIASLIAGSTNKVYLNSESLMMSTLSESAIEEPADKKAARATPAPAPAAATGGWGF